MNKRFLYSIFIFIFTTSIGFSQKKDIKFRKVSIEKGLSQSTIHCVYQDSRGFMWFGTQDGLNKYDGYKFTVFKHLPDDTTTLSHNTVQAIYEDSRQNLWIGTMYGGLNRFNREKQTFIHFKNNADNPNSISHNSVSCIIEDNEHNLWIGTKGGGLNKLSLAGKPKFSHYLFDKKNMNSVNSDNIYSLLVDSAGLLWIGTDKGIAQYVKDCETKKFFYRYHFPLQDGAERLPVFDLFEKEKGKLWCATDGQGIWIFDNEKEMFSQQISTFDSLQTLNSDVVYSIFRDTKQQIWIGTDKGLSRLRQKYDTENLLFETYTSNYNEAYSLSNNSVRDIYQDHSGVLWIGTYYGGLNKYDVNAKPFHHYKLTGRFKNHAANNTIRAIFEDSHGFLWVGTYGAGLYRIDRENERMLHFNNQPDNKKSISHNVIRAIHQDSRGYLWVGTDYGLNRTQKPLTGDFQQAGISFVRFFHQPGDSLSLPNNMVYCIYEDSFGDIWIGTHQGGLAKFNHTNNNFIRYKHKPDNPKSLSNDMVSVIFEDSFSRLWIGTYGGGLNRFNRQTENFVRYKPQENNSNGLINSTIRSICEDKEGALWIGSSGGLTKMSFSGKGDVFFTNFTVKDGLPNDVVYGVLSDKEDNIWCSTNRGLSKYNRHKKKFKNYDVRDGLQSNEFNAGTYFKSQSGEMFFGGINGFNAFFPSEIEDNPYKPKVTITDFLVFNKSVDIHKKDALIEKHIMEIDTITLSYKNNSFSFEFSALHYAIPEKNRYAYKMEGFDKEWIYTGAKRRFVTYTNLDPGKYQFKIIASNSDGVWNYDGKIIHIIITPPFWQTGWFYVLEFMLFATLVFVFIKWRERKLIRDNIRLEEKIKERTFEINQQKEEIKTQAEYLQQSNIELEKLSIVASRTDNAIIIMDEKGNFEWVNEGFTRMFGYTFKELVSERSKNIIGPNTHPKIKKHIQDCLKNKQSVIYEYTTIAKNNERKWVQTTLTPIKDDYGNIVKLVAIDTDISEMKKAEDEIKRQRDELRKLNATKDKFFSIIAHDLKGPLGSFRGLTSLLFENFDTFDKEELKQLIGDIHKSSNETFNLLENLLEWSRSQRGEMKFNLQKTDLRTIIIDTLELLKSNAKNKNIALTSDIPDYTEVYADENMIKTVIRNLLNNAIKFTNPQGKVKISVKDKDKFFEIAVSDTGIGIKPENLDKLFQLDVHFTTLGTKKEIGTGLGLILCKEFIEAHNGEITVHSDVGKGTTFKFTIPKELETKDIEKTKEI